VRTRRLFGAVAALFLLSANAPADPAVAFGARENVEFIALSPDGSRVAYGVPIEGLGSRLYWLEVGSTQPRAITKVDGRDQRITGCNWVSNQRLVCGLYNINRVAGYLGSGSRLIALDIDGSNVRVLDGGSRRLWGGDVIDWLADREDRILVIDPEGVVEVDTASGKRRRVETRLGGDFVTDGRGQLRIRRFWQRRGATDQAAAEILQYYRRAGSDEWVELGRYDTLTDRGPLPLAVDAERDAVYIKEEDKSGRDIVYRMALDGSGRRDLTISHPSVDMDGVIRLGRRGRVVGATYATERRQTTYFDPELQRVAQQLSRALPGQPLINFVGASDDEGKLLIWAGSDTDPGTYYVLDRKTLSLTRIMRSRPELDGVRLASVRPVSYRAADGTDIPAYLTLPPGGSGRGLPAIVMPHGGPSARDEWGFDWLAQYFAHRGYAVLQPNFRGSAGYGSEWFQINGFQSWRTAIGDVVDAGRWLVAEGIADAARLAIAGWSYGGYAALQSAVVEPELFKAVVAIAPVTDLQRARDEWKGPFRANSRDFFGMGPHIAAGSPARHAERIRAPVLLFHGDEDLNVRVGQSRLMRDRLRDAGRPVDYVEFPQLDHQLEDSAARARLLRDSDAFLRQALGM
jgi:dipeptidyl aminopeptidase/acylaminoacyl peptidase